MLKLVAPIGTAALLKEISMTVVTYAKNLDEDTKKELTQVILNADRLNESQISDLLFPLYNCIREYLNYVVRVETFKGNSYVTLYRSEEINLCLQELITKYQNNALTFVQSVDLIIEMITDGRDLNPDMMELRDNLMEADIIDAKGHLLITRDQLTEMEPDDNNSVD